MLKTEQIDVHFDERGCFIGLQQIDTTRWVKKDLQPMDSTGQDFDPELHEAITEIPAPTEEMKGKSY